MKKASHDNGAPLATRIERSRRETGVVAVWYLGQSGFLLQHGGTTVAIDPYLSYAVDRLPPEGFWRRAYPPPVPPEKLAGVDLVLCTHDHLDHTEPETLRGIAAVSPGCHFAGPRPSIDRIRGEGIATDRTTILRADREFPFRDVRVEPVSVAHEEHETDAEGFDLFLGYLVRWIGLTFFHAGDTIVTPKLAASLEDHRIDVAFLPINGRSEERHRQNIVGNMDAAEAVAFATEQQFGLVVPVHWDLYAVNGAPLADFVAALERVPMADRPAFKAFRPGERIVQS